MPEEQSRKDIVSAKKVDTSFPLGEVPEYEDDIVSGWVPHMKLAVADSRKQAYP